MPVSVLAGRYTGQDAAIHEDVLLDLAAAIKWLKEERGFTQIVLLGHSGGGSLMAYYQSQATTRTARAVHVHAGRRSARPERLHDDSG